MAKIIYQTRDEVGRFGPMNENTLNSGCLETTDFDTSHLTGKWRKMADKMNKEVFGPHMGIWSGGGCRTWNMNEHGNLRLTYDGGDIYDYLSFDGEMAYYDSKGQWELQKQIIAIAKDFGFETEAGYSWATDFWPN